MVFFCSMRFAWAELDGMVRDVQYRRIENLEILFLILGISYNKTDFWSKELNLIDIEEF